MSTALRRKAGLGRITDTLVPLSNGVAALGATLDDLTLDGRSWRAELGDAALNAALERTTDGASTIVINVHDPDGALLRSPLLAQGYTAVVDGLSFTSVKTRRQDRTTLELTLEATNVARLRIAAGARKAKPGTVNRAAFALSLVREVKAPPIPFYSPQLMVPVRLADQRDVRANAEGKNARREPGIPPGFKGTVKGVAANAEQLHLIETVLDVGSSLKAPYKALLSSILTVIVENNATNGKGGDRDSTGAFQQRASMGWPASNDVAKDATAYFKGISGHPGAIAVVKANPSIKAADVSQKVQASGTPTAYAEWVDEGTAWLKAYLQGRSAGGATKEGKAQTALERQKGQTTWDAIGQLATDVNYERFEAADIVYFMAQTDLLGSQSRMVIEDSTPGIFDVVTFDADSGKRANTAEVSAAINAWEAPPGTVVDLGESLGLAAGRYQVTSIRNPMFAEHPRCDVTLTKPTPPTAEPTAAKGSKKAKAKKVRSSTTASGADAMVKWARSQVGVSEGSSQQRTYANALGYSPSLPWCSLFVAYGLKTACGFKSLPGNPAYSGDWLSWSGGKKVDASKLLPGDLVIFDWGDGGLTDHVALYVGGGMVIGGNQSNAVTKVTLNRGAIVGCVRPNYG